MTCDVTSKSVAVSTWAAQLWSWAFTVGQTWMQTQVFSLRSCVTLSKQLCSLELWFM
jgi:hypothetical protein